MSLQIHQDTVVCNVLASPATEPELCRCMVQHQVTARNKQTRLSLLSNQVTVKHEETNLFTVQSLNQQDQYKGAVVKEKTSINPPPATHAVEDEQPARQRATNLRTTKPTQAKRHLNSQSRIPGSN